MMRGWLAQPPGRDSSGHVELAEPLESCDLLVGGLATDVLAFDSLHELSCIEPQQGLGKTKLWSAMGMSGGGSERFPLLWAQCEVRHRLTS